MVDLTLHVDGVEIEIGDDQFDPEKHPRVPAGSSEGGEFAPKGGASPDTEGPKEGTHEYWVTGAGKDQPTGYWNVWAGGKQEFINQPAQWRKKEDVILGFFGRHGVNLKTDDDNPPSDTQFIEKAQALDSAMTDLAQRFPGLGPRSLPGYEGYKNLKLAELQHIELTKGRYFTEDQQRRQASYAARSETIRLSSSLNKSDRVLLKGDWTVTGSSLPGTFRHELGHAIMSRVRAVLRAQGATDSLFELYNDDKPTVAKNLSRYAASNVKEWFAESFAAYTHPQYGQRGPRINPVLEKAFDQILKDMPK